METLNREAPASPSTPFRTPTAPLSSAEKAARSIHSWKASHGLCQQSVRCCNPAATEQVSAVLSLLSPKRAALAAMMHGIDPEQYRPIPRTDALSILGLDEAGAAKMLSEARACLRALIQARRQKIALIFDSEPDLALA